MADTIKEALKYSNGVHELIWSQLKNTPFPSDARTGLVLAYVSIALDHQEAIIRLIEMKLYAPAFALLRLELETVFRGLWVNLPATDEQVASIGQEGGEPFPRPFSTFATDLDKSYGAGEWMSGFAARWKTLNGFTHSGLEQLGRRFRVDGNIGSNYPDAMVSEVVTISGTLLLGMMMPIYKKLGLSEKANALDKWLDESVQPPNPNVGA
jgi:hypothetical protein